MIQRYSINVTPMGAPRQTRADAWLKRPCVIRYHAYRDTVRASTRGIMTEPIYMHVVAFVEMPRSWSAKKRAAMVGTINRQKPDADNIYKATSDAIITKDQCIGAQLAVKFWSESPRVEIVVADEMPGWLLPNLLALPLPVHPAAGQ